MNRIYRATATVLPALLAQGLIYLCIQGALDFLSALFGVVAIGASAMLAMSLARREEAQRLVWRNHAAVLLGREVRGAGAR